MDVFGKMENKNYTKGLVDVESSSVFEEKLEDLQGITGNIYATQERNSFS